MTSQLSHMNREKCKATLTNLHLNWLCIPVPIKFLTVVEICFKPIL